VGGSPGAVIWLTGLSGAGKTTISRALGQALTERGHAVELLDGDVLRQLMPGTGFSAEERDRHVRRTGVMASRLAHHGVTVVAALISPTAAARNFVRSMCPRFVEVYVSTPLEECERRDPKQLYARARRGDIQEFTGVSAPYEPPADAEVVIDTRTCSVEASVALVLDALDRA
jgi:adenylylsulfate kinase